MYQLEGVDDHHDVEVPQYFLCPISLHIMKDPVTAPTGITYDRRSILHWLAMAADPVCPVTKKPLPRDADLTPNHTLRRLINACCSANAHREAHRISATITRSQVGNILRGLTVPRLHSAALDQLLPLATSDDHLVDRSLLADSGVPKALVLFIIKCCKDNRLGGLEKAFRILTSMWTDVKADLVENNGELVDSLTWVFNHENANNYDSVKNAAIPLLNAILKVASTNLIERLKPEFFNGVVGMLRQSSQGGYDAIGATKAALQLMLELTQHGRNKYKIIEANAIFELIELDLDLGLTKPEYKKVTELVFCLLAQLCSCTDGRAQLLAHAGAISAVSNRILRVSPVVDDRAVHILAQISKNTATNEAVQEMMRVGAVFKLCLVLQADCAKYLKEKVREILRSHSQVWRKSPCFQIYLLST